MNLIFFVIIGAVVEILVWIGVAQFISGWYVFFWFILAAVIGFGLIRSSISTLMPQLQQMQMSGQMNTDRQSSRKIAVAFAGILLLIPGLISDLCALLVLLPPVQNALTNALKGVMAKRQQAMMDKMMGGMGGNAGNPFADMMRQMQDMQNQQRGGSNVIDGEAHEVKADKKKIGMKDVK